jgi:hypothetical protein
LAGDVVEIIVGDGLGANDRTEDLLADHLHVGLGVGQDGRLDEVAAIAEPFAATGHDLGAFLDA